jgi:hypothetical protein
LMKEEVSEVLGFYQFRAEFWCGLAK